MMLDHLVRNWCTKRFVLFVLCCFLISLLNLAKAKDLGRISGKILDPQGVPVAGAHLKLVTTGGNLIRESTSDSQSNFTLDGVDSGEYQLRGESDSFVSVIVNVSLAAGQLKEVNVQFQQLASAPLTTPKSLIWEADPVLSAP